VSSITPGYDTESLLANGSAPLSSASKKLNNFPSQDPSTAKPIFVRKGGARGVRFSFMKFSGLTSVEVSRLSDLKQGSKQQIFLCLKQSFN